MRKSPWYPLIWRMGRTHSVPGHKFNAFNLRPYFRSVSQAEAGALNYGHNSRYQAFRRHDPSDFFPLFFTNCVCVAGHQGILFFFSTQQSLSLPDNFPHYLIKKFKVRTFRKTVCMRSILLARTHKIAYGTSKGKHRQKIPHGRSSGIWQAGIKMDSKHSVKAWNGLYCLRFKLGADRYEGGNDILGSIKIIKFWPAERPSGTHESLLQNH